MNTGSWNFKLATAEFANNTYVNRITSKSPHEIVYDFRPKQPIDLIPMSDHIRASNFTSSFASHVHDLHKEVMDKIAQSNANYKLRADVRKRFKTFNVGDYVNIRIRPEQILPGTVKKLHARSSDPFQILKKLNYNAYVIDLLQDFGISSTSMLKI